MKRLADLVRKIEAVRDLDAALPAWDQFKKEYGNTQYAKDNAGALAKLGGDLAEAVIRIRGAAVPQWVRDSEWSKIVPKLEAALQEADKVAPLDPERRKTVEQLIQFGQSFVAEKEIYDAMFSVLPWKGLALAALKASKSAQVSARAALYARIFDVDVKCQEDAIAQRAYAKYEMRGDEREYVQDVYVRLARYNAVFTFWKKDRDHCTWAEIEAANEFQNTGGSGTVMTIIMLEDLLAPRRAMPKDIRPYAELDRLGAYARVCPQVPYLRPFVIQQAKQLILDYRTTGDFPARFCLLAAEQYEAAGDFENAEKYFEKVLDPRSPIKHYQWQGYLGRGRVRERTERYASALADYETALKHSAGWYNGYCCAQAIANLCVQSGKLDKRDRAEAAVNEVLGRAESRSEQDRTRALLNKK